MHIPFLSNLFKSRDKPQNYYLGTDFRYLFGPSTSGNNVNEFTAMQTTAVYACVRILSETLAALPLQLYRYTPGGKERVYDHPLYHLLHDEPNPEMTSFIFRETLMSHLLIWGNAYAHKVAVLEEGMKYQPIGIPPEEAQFLETRKFQLNEIARLYRIPPHMIGNLDKSSFNNIEQQSMEFVKYTLDPWVIRWEQAMQKALFLPEEKKQYFLKFNVNGLMRGDYESRMTGYSIGRQNGWLSANDIREMEDMNPVPDEEGGNLYLVNGSMTKLKDAGAFAKIGENESPDLMKVGIFSVTMERVLLKRKKYGSTNFAFYYHLYYS